MRPPDSLPHALNPHPILLPTMMGGGPGRTGFTPAGKGGMDVARGPEHGRKRRRRRWLLAGGALLALAAATVGLARLHPAVPTVERANVWIDTVRRGPMIRQVRGLGTLVPEDITWIAARTDARVERIVVQPGATVTTDTVILLLGNPELQGSVVAADTAVTAAQARLVNLRAQLEGTSLERQSAFAKAQGDSDTAAAQVEVNEKLSKQGLVAVVEYKKSQIVAKELAACRGDRAPAGGFHPAGRRAADRGRAGRGGRRESHGRPAARRTGRAPGARRDGGRAPAGARGSGPARRGRDQPRPRGRPDQAQGARSRFRKPRRATSWPACPRASTPATGSSRARFRASTRP